MSQATYALEPAVGRHGQEYDAGFNDHISAVATEDIPMGSVVCRVAGDPSKCKLPASAADVTTPGSVLGVALYDSTMPQAEANTVALYKSGSRVQILHVGRVRIRFEDAVPGGAPLLVRHGGTGTRGAIRAGADADAAALAGANAYQGAGAGAVGVVELNRRGV
jgi:hypothetical protein